jgi:protein-tyrosine phosphatase
VLKSRLFWLLVLLALALGGNLGVRPLIEWYSRPPPNYSAIDTDLYMGGHVDAPPPGTRAVLSLTPIKDSYTADQYQWSPILDAAPAPTLAWLRQQVDFIDAQRRAGQRVFVHCEAGVSRSGP